MKPQIIQHNTRLNMEDLLPAPHVMTVGMMKSLGTDGFGTLQADGKPVVGELSLVDGHARLSDINNHTRIPDDEEEVYFMQVANFEPTVKEVPVIVDMSSIPDAQERDRAVRKAISDSLALASGMRSPIFAIMKGCFNQATLRSVDGSAADYLSLDSIIKQQQTYEVDPGRDYTLIAFQASTNDVSGDDTFNGVHIHAISADRAEGGHIHLMSGFKGVAAIMPVDPAKWLVSVPSNDGPSYRRVLHADETQESIAKLPRVPQSALAL